MNFLNIGVGLLIWILFSGCSKDKIPPGGNEIILRNQILVSEIKTEKGKTFLEVDGRPFPILGAQIRLDALVNGDKMTDAEIEEYFIKAKELGVNCVQIPIWWNKLEPKIDQYKYDFVQQVLSWANNYNLKVELLWFSTNMVGDSFSYLVPQYILSNIDYRLYRNDDGSFWNYYGYQYSMKLDADWVLERERKMVSNLMNFIRNWDEDNGNKRTVISVQIHNEPDALLRWRMDQKQIRYRNGDVLTKQAAWDMILTSLNEVGKAVQSSTYKVATRVNLISGNGIQPFPEASVGKATDVSNLEGISFLSFDPYKEKINQIRDEVLAYRSIPGNYPLVAENKGSYTNTASLILTSVALGSGYGIYDLATSKFFIDNTSADYVDQIDHGVYTWDLQDKPHTESVKRILSGLNKTSELVAITPPADFAAFNIQEDYPEQSKDQVVQTTNAKFTFNTSAGALAFALDRKDYLLIYATESASFKIENGSLGSVGEGHFDDQGEFVLEKPIQAEGSLVKVEGGKLYYIQFASIGSLSSTTDSVIGN